jgi:hypothetical protein
MNRTRPSAEKVTFSCGTHCVSNDQPRCYRHIASNVVAAFACDLHVRLDVPDGVVDAVKGLPDHVISAVRTRLYDQLLHESTIEIVGQFVFSVPLSCVCKNCLCNVLTSTVSRLEQLTLGSSHRFF